MLKTGDIIYKVTLEGYDIPCVVVKKYKVGPVTALTAIQMPVMVTIFFMDSTA